MAAAPPTATYHVEVTAAPDVMDLHSDGDFRFGSGEGDIEIDLQPTDQHNDDLSIYDAASDTGLEVQTVAADQDDFMVDNEDVIEEDTATYDDNDVHVVDVEQSANGPIETAENDEDLIDYSDDEEESMWTGHEEVPLPAQVEADDVAKDDRLNQPLHEKSVEPVGSDTQTHAYQHETDTGLGGEISPTGTHTHVDDFENFDEQPEEAYGNSNIHDGSTEEARTALADDSTYPAVDTANITQNDTTLTKPTDKKDEAQLPPVTVNYDGAELWLFKLHDYENSGDYLVEDEGLATKPLSHVLEACREPLGSDVSDDMELGFRLDNFHNIELFQEHTSCAFVTLQSLLSLYHQLHLQDGVSNPESFYMTLLFRPRVSSLLNELQNAAAEGIGHSGLERAIAAGLTAFNAQTSHNSTEHVPEDWANGEEEQEPDVPHVDPEEHVDEVEGNTQHDSDTQELYGQEQHNDESVEQSVQSTAPAPATTAASVHHDTPVAEDRSSVKDAEEGAQPLVDKPASNSQHASPTPHNDDDDILDYSDDEPEEEVAHTNVARATPPSSASSTVQGDVSNTDDHVQPSVDEQDPAIDQSSNGHAVDDVTASATYQEEQDALYEGFDESYGEDYVEENDAHVAGIAGGVNDEYPEEHPTHTDDETTNQYDDAEHDTGAARLDLSLDAPDEHSNNPASPSAFLDNFVNEDESTDLQAREAYADLWTEDQTGAHAEDDEIGFDDEDGAAGQAPVAASAAAKPADTLSSELFELSPQGQKRTIDEAAIDANGATDPSDAKRPRV